jgi:pyruvate/2-oxoacid:ferredoxin oxidoreductase alpha subunit
MAYVYKGWVGYAKAYIGRFLYQSVETGITAAAGGTQAGARALTKTINHVTTVATAADSVKLPSSEVGMVIHVVNGAAANSMQVFGAGTDTINDVATATGVAQAAGKSATYVCPVAGKWYRTLSA